MDRLKEILNLLKEGSKIGRIIKKDIQENLHIMRFLI